MTWRTHADTSKLFDDIQVSCRLGDLPEVEHALWTWLETGQPLPQAMALGREPHRLCLEARRNGLLVQESVAIGASVGETFASLRVAVEGMASAMGCRAGEVPAALAAWGG
jgi:hypothetical protein